MLDPARRVATFATAVALAGCALAVALPFRARVLAQADPLRYSWDAALHVLSGLDLWDDVRRAALPSALFHLLTPRWWGPTWALVTAPFYGLFGASIRSATLPSLLAFALAPAAAWLFVRRTTGSHGLLAVPLLLVFFLRSPLLLEASAWPMFESAGGLASLIAWLLFARGSRRTACAIAAALFFLKYHYGAFLGATLLLATVAELPREERRALAGRAVGLLRRPAVAAPLLLALVLAAARFATENGSTPPPLPSVSNVAWGVLVLAVLAALARRSEARELWRALPETLRAFAIWAAALPLAWLLDPANARAWWRQIHQDWVVNPPGPIQNARALASFFRADFTVSAWTIPLLLGGLLLAGILGRRDRTLPYAALFCVWPPVAMCFSAFPVEPRFLGCALPTMFACSTAGLILLAASVPLRARPAAGIVLAAALAAPLPCAQARWESELERRTAYTYANRPADERFVSEILRALPRDGAIVVALPRKSDLGPSIRLALRMRDRERPPRAVIVGDEPLARLIVDVPGPARRVALATAEPEPTTPGFRVTSRRPGPRTPDGVATFLFSLER